MCVAGRILRSDYAYAKNNGLYLDNVISKMVFAGELHAGRCLIAMEDQPVGGSRREGDEEKAPRGVSFSPNFCHTKETRFHEMTRSECCLSGSDCSPGTIVPWGGRGM